MKKLIILTTVLVFLMVFVIPFIGGLLIKMIPGGDQPSYDFNNKRGIYGIYFVTQVFTATDNNLTAIGTSVGNPNLKNQKEIIVDLKDMDGNLIREVKINGTNVPDGDIIKFVFDPIPDSKNKKYIFMISSPGAGPEELINIFFSNQKTSWIGPATYYKEINENGMPLVAYFKPPSHLRVALDIYSSWFKRILGVN